VTKQDTIDYFEAALRQPDVADWRDVAVRLHAALTMRPAKRAKERTDGYTAIAEYVTKGKSARRGPSMVATFEDGTQVRMSFASQEGKPVNAGLGLRVVCSAYRTKRAFPINDLKAINRMGVPPIRSAQVERDGEVLAVYHPDDCNAYTDPYRQGIPHAVWRARVSELRVAA
jgi:hypothetical protein